MKVSASKLLKQIKDERESNRRGRVTFYVNLKLYEAFQKACGNEAASAVVEMLMKEFIESAKP